MKCRFCKMVLDESGGGRIKCRFCQAKYEPIGQEYDGRLRYQLVAEPPPEIANRCAIRNQLLECADMVLGKPGDALVLLEDIWVGLWSDTHGADHTLVAELDKLRATLLGVAKIMFGLFDSLSYVDLRTDPTRVAGHTLDQLHSMRDMLLAVLTARQLKELGFKELHNESAD